MNLFMFAATKVFGMEIPVTALFTYGASAFVVLFALPSYFSTLRQRGIFLGLLLLVLLGVFAVAFETFAVKTGVPYGKYTYDSVLGNKILDGAPWTIGIAYPVLLLGAFWLASKITSSFLRPLFTALFAAATIVVLDPAAVKLQLWKWETPGRFYGVPLSHIIGWAVAGLVGAWFIQLFWGDKDVKRGLGYSALLMMLFWTGVNIGIGQPVPAAAGGAVSVVMIVIMILEKRASKKDKEDPSDNS